jgi:hypothetical protein
VAVTLSRDSAEGLIAEVESKSGSVRLCQFVEDACAGVDDPSGVDIGAWAPAGWAEPCR